MADTQWLKESGTGRWYVNWRDLSGRTIRRYSDELEQQDAQPASQLGYQEVSEGYQEAYQAQYQEEVVSGDQSLSRRRNRETPRSESRRPPITSSTSTRNTRRQSASFAESSRHAELIPEQNSRREKKYQESQGYNRPTGERSDDRSPYETHRNPRPDLTAGSQQDAYYAEDSSVLSATGEMERMTVRDSDVTTGPHYIYSPPQPSAGPSMLNTAGPPTQWHAAPVPPPPQPQWRANVGPDMVATGRGNSRRQPRLIPVVGDPRSGQSEKLDPSFKMRNNDYQTFFQCGRVFKTLWTDPAGPSNNNASENDQFVSRQKFKVAHGQWVYSKIRRFVVVKQNDRSCQCLPVTTYGGKGVQKGGINLNAHGLIHNVDEVVPDFPDISKRSLKVKPAKNGERLSNNSIINYGRAYCVDTNVKVKDLGELNHESKKWLKRYYKEMQFPPDDDSSDPSYSYTQNPKLQAAQLTGVGGGAEDYYGPQVDEHEASMTSHSSRAAGKRRQTSGTWADADSSRQCTSETRYNAQEYDQDDPTPWSPETEESHISPSHGGYMPTFDDEYQRGEHQEHYEQRPVSDSMVDTSHLPPVDLAPRQTGEPEYIEYDEEEDILAEVEQPRIQSATGEKHKERRRHRDRGGDGRRRR